MFKITGILVIVNALVFTAWWVTGEHSHKRWVFTLFLTAVFVGIFLILQERVTELTVKGIGTIKSAAEQASTDAKAISDLKKRVESQSATVDLVAKDAADAKELVNELSKKNVEIESYFKKSVKLTSEIVELQEKSVLINEFMMTVINAQNDVRKSHDKLLLWSKDKSFVLNSQAWQAWKEIVNKHNPIAYRSNRSLPWKEGVDPSKLTLSDLKRNYQNQETLSFYKPALIEYIWKRKDIPKKERMAFLIDVIRNDDSLTAVEYAGRFFAKGAGIKLHPLAIEEYSKWWEENREKYSKNPEDRPIDSPKKK